MAPFMLLYSLDSFRSSHSPRMYCKLSDLRPFSIRFAEEGLTLASSLHAIMKIKWMYGQKIDQLRETRDGIRRDLIKMVSSFGQE